MKADNAGFIKATEGVDEKVGLKKRKDSKVGFKYSKIFNTI